MKILFIVPTIKELRLKKNLRPVGSKFFRVPFLGILKAASCLPREYDITVIDEHIEMVDYDFDCDLVGLTVATPTAKRSFEIAHEFRKRGKKVFVGGFHPTFNRQECLEHVDSVVVGEAEGNIERLVEDFRRTGRIESVYERSDFCRGGDIPAIRQELIRHPKQYFTINVLESSRGCVFNCDFCGVRQFYRDSYRTRPIDAVIEEISRMKDRKVLFTDDNLIGNIDHAKKLFRRLIPLKKWWMGQMSINCAQDDELLDLAKRSGCFGVFVGFETINPATIQSENKAQNLQKDYKQVIARLHKHGLGVAAGLMFGFDNDRPKIFKKTVDYFLSAKVDAIQVDPVTAFPGTPLFEKFKKENRLLTMNWDRYNIAETTFRPRGMTAEDLEAGISYVRKRFYTFPMILIRFFRVLWWRHLIAALVFAYISWGYWLHLKQKIGYPP